MNRQARKRRERAAKRAPRKRLRFWLLALGLAAGAYLWWRPSFAALRLEHQRLQARWARRASRDPLLRRPLAGDLVLAVPRAYTQKLAERASAHLLRRIPLELAGLHFRKSGSVDKKLLVAKVGLGSWSLDVRIAALHAVLQGGVPRVRYVESGAVALALPVDASSGSAEGRLSFAWNSHGLANALCRDFAVRLPVSARVSADRQEVSGQLELGLREGGISAVPRFGGQSLRVHVEPSDETWAAAERALEAQDSFWRCGVALKPQDLLARLRELAAEGFVVKLPQQGFHALDLPGAFELTLGHAPPVRLQIAPTGLRVDAGLLWYAARGRVRAEGSPRP